MGPLYPRNSGAFHPTEVAAGAVGHAVRHVFQGRQGRGAFKEDGAGGLASVVVAASFAW